MLSHSGQGNSLLVPHRVLVAVVPRLGQVCLGLELSAVIEERSGWRTYINIVFLQEGKDALVVLERYLLRPREGLEAWHVSPACPETVEDVLGQGRRVQLEVGLEKEVGDVVDSPLP